MSKKHILLIAQVSPLIHGQAVMSAQLASLMKSWPEAKVRTINTCYTTDRGKLGSFSLRKVVLWLGYLAKLLSSLCFSKVDTIVMTHSFFLGPFIKDSFFLWLCRASGKKIIGWVHMDPNRFPWHTASRLVGNYAKRVIQLPDLWVACAPALIRQWPDAFDRKKVIAICNGIPDPNPKTRSSESQQIRVIFLSSMTKEKGWQELFSAAETICSEMDNIIFDFYGGPGASETQENLNEKFAKSAAPSRIRWHGELWGDRKIEVLSQAHLFCLPSWTEAFPIAILEAMACGLPVIATQVGGISDAITHQVNGWLYPPQDEAALLRLLKSILSDRCQLQRIGEINRQKFLEQFSYEAFGLKWRQVLLGN
jgi:glycosyltransferase involved in cell wall biosynthesis